MRKNTIAKATAAISYAVLALLLTMTPAHADVIPAPKKLCDGLETAQAWAAGIAAGVGVIGLIIIGVSMMFAHRNETITVPFKQLGFWIGGAVLIAGASAIVAAFISTTMNCAAA